MNTIDKIDSILKLQGKKQKDLCDFIGVRNNRYTDWKSGRIKSYHKYLPKIAQFLNVKIEDLLEEELRSAPKSENVEFFTTPKEREVISSYRQHPELQPVIDKLLDIPQEDTEEIYVAAESSVINLEENIISEDLARRLIEAPAKDKL